MKLRIGKLGASVKETLGGFRAYHLSRGLTVAFESSEVLVRGGNGSLVALPVSNQSGKGDLLSPGRASDVLEQVQRTVGVRLVGAAGHESDESLFAVDGSVISGASLAEELLGRLKVIEQLVRGIIQSSSGIKEDELHAIQETCAVIHKKISEGITGPRELSGEIDEFRKRGAGSVIEVGFFLLNAEIIAEDMRTSILAACRHFGNLANKLNHINLTHPGPGAPRDRWEYVHWSPQVEEVAFFFASSVIACYTSLDLLYQYFIYLTRRPLLNPEFPKDLHFPDARERPVFQAGGTAVAGDIPGSILPFAIPNLRKEQFAALRRNRNDLVHNMAADAIRPRVYVGSGLPPVNCHQLQYVQYMTRDTDATGSPVTHPWARRFYTSRSDAQEVLIGWLEQSWQCIFDTTEWLTHRLDDWRQSY